MRAGGPLSFLARLRELLCHGFSLTRQEAVSLLLLLGILLVGLVAKTFLR